MSAFITNSHPPVRFHSCRPQALRRAVAHRARLAGEDPAELFKQAEYILCYSLSAPGGVG